MGNSNIQFSEFIMYVLNLFTSLKVLERVNSSYYPPSKIRVCPLSECWLSEITQTDTLLRTSTDAFSWKLEENVRFSLCWPGVIFLIKRESGSYLVGDDNNNNSAQRRECVAYIFARLRQIE